MNELPDLIQALNHRDSEADVAALSARLEIFRDKSPVTGHTPIDSEPDQAPWPGQLPVPEVPADAFDANVLRSAMASAGAIIVRGFIDPSTAASYKSVIDEVLSAPLPGSVEPGREPTATTPFNNTPEILKTFIKPADLAKSRDFQRRCGSAMCVEASSVAEHLLELYDEKGLKEIIGDYLEEIPCLSAKKWVLRQSVFPINPFGWHQDGAFMGTDINSINMWIPLDRCGDNTGAPGLDVLPIRLREVLKSGTDGAAFNWSVSEGDINQEYGEDTIISPVFNAGDAFFFDHFYLHRTQYKEVFERHRYAIETWFFGSGNFPKNQIPLAW